MDIAAKQEESKNCRRNEENCKSVNKKDCRYPDQCYYPYGLRHCLNPEWIIDLGILMALF